MIRVLGKNNLEVVAVHSHMLFEEPRIIFLHYYRRGTADKLAAGFRVALSELGKHGGVGNMIMKIGSKIGAGKWDGLFAVG